VNVYLVWVNNEAKSTILREHSFKQQTILEKKNLKLNNLPNILPALNSFIYSMCCFILPTTSCTWEI